MQFNPKKLEKNETFHKMFHFYLKSNFQESKWNV